MKFGGSSVATVDKLRQVAGQVVARRRAGCEVVVVVSAMGDATDRLLEQAKAVAGEPDRRELDMLLSVGERISMALLAMAIREAGLDAVSLTGSQSGIITTKSHARARIIEVRPFRVEDELEAGRVVIVAGYQGVSYTREITTLGRGGSDTTAVALAAALDAEACELWSDVDGVYTADPRVVPDATRIDVLDTEAMLALAESGAKVVHARAVELAREEGIALYARKTGSDAAGTVIRRDAPVSGPEVKGIAHQTRVLELSAPAARLPAVLDTLEALEIEPAALEVHGERLNFRVPLSDLPDQARLVSELETRLETPIPTREDRGVVTAVGDGVASRPERLSRALAAAKAEGISVEPSARGSDRLELRVASAEVETLVRALHAAFSLGASASLAAPLREGDSRL